LGGQDSEVIVFQALIDSIYHVLSNEAMNYLGERIHEVSRPLLIYGNVLRILADEFKELTGIVDRLGLALLLFLSGLGVEGVASLRWCIDYMIGKSEGRYLDCLRIDRSYLTYRRDEIYGKLSEIIHARREVRERGELLDYWINTSDLIIGVIMSCSSEKMQNKLIESLREKAWRYDLKTTKRILSYL
jgi:hypothetical protein